MAVFHRSSAVIVGNWSVDKPIPFGRLYKLSTKKTTSFWNVIPNQRSKGSRQTVELPQVHHYVNTQFMRGYHVFSVMIIDKEEKFHNKRL